MEAMSIVAPGTEAPPVPGLDVATGSSLLLFYKVTCPVCQMAAPAAERIHQSFPDAFAGIGQDPPERLDAFGRDHGVSFPSVPDLPPYPVSDAYGIRVVPTLVLVDTGTVADVIESWDRDGWNRAVTALAERRGVPFVPVSEPGDGLPPFRPG
jgi:thiol-disulfide isomerase/thioredoxin